MRVDKELAEIVLTVEQTIALTVELTDFLDQAVLEIVRGAAADFGASAEDTRTLIALYQSKLTETRDGRLATMRQMLEAGAANLH